MHRTERRLPLPPPLASRAELIEVCRHRNGADTDEHPVDRQWRVYLDGRWLGIAFREADALGWLEELLATAPRDGVGLTCETVTREQVVEEARRRFGPDPMHWAFECPNCGDVASIGEWPESERDRAGRECIGRLLGALRGSPLRWGGRGCDWSAFGLISGPVTVVLPDGRQLPGFALADPARGIRRSVPA